MSVIIQSLIFLITSQNASSSLIEITLTVINKIKLCGVTKLTLEFGMKFNLTRHFSMSDEETF